MLDKIVTLSKKFISIKSNSNNATELDKILDLALSNLEGYTIERFENNGFKSALIYNGQKRPAKFKIILNGHLDVVPGKDYQYRPKVMGDRLYGAGAMDMKASVACLIAVFKEVANKVDYPLGLQLVTDEETGGFNGTKYQIDQGIRADFVLAGESTNLNIVNKAKGILWLKILSKGKTAHSAYPWNGKNAISEMSTFLKNLEKLYPVPSQQECVTTINVSRVTTTNATFNKIPDNCEAWLDIRYVPEDKSVVINKITKLLPHGFTMTIIENEVPLFVDENNLYVTTLQDIAKNIKGEDVLLYGAQGSSDARHYALVNGTGVEFGPIGGGIGSDKEWVSISSLDTFTKILGKFLRSYNKCK